MYFHTKTFCQLIQNSFFSFQANLVHSFYVCLFISLFFPVRMLVYFGQLLDYIFFPKFRSQPLYQPILITGNPRSGTTFLHRLLANDSQFSSTKLYQTIFPSVAFYYLFNSCEQIFNPLMEWLDKNSFQGWDGIHKTKLNGFEEDETFFVWALLTPVISLLFPFAHQMKSAAWVDKLPQKTRLKLMNYYQGCLKRHLYATGKKKTLLIKNTTCTGRLSTMLESWQDYKIIHLIRHPYECLPSLMSMYEASWDIFAPQTRINKEAYKNLADLYAQYYRHRVKICQEIKENNPHNLIEIRYEELVENPYMIVKRIYDKFNLKIDDSFFHSLKKQIEVSQSDKSRHHYSLEKFGLTKKQIYEMMPDIFEFYGFES